MKTSDQTNELDQALSSFQGEMPVITKNVNVKMNGISKAGKEFKVDYDYAPLDSIQAIANPLLSKHGLNVSQDIGSTFEGGQVFNFISTRVGHKSGQWKVSQWFLDMAGVTKEQDRGSKITYNKRYAFVAALNIALSDEDNDAVGVGAGMASNSNAKGSPQAEKQKNISTQGQQKELSLDDINMLGNFAITYGSPKIKGKRVKDVPIHEIENCVNYFVTEANKKGQEIKGELKYQIDILNKWLGGQPPQLPNEDLKF